MMTSLKHLGAVLLVTFYSMSVASTQDPSSTIHPQRAQQKTRAPQQQITCVISPELCMTDPIARGCGEGRHWSSAGSGMAHCVDDDRDCANGKAGKRDEFDNLVCGDEKAVDEEGAGQRSLGTVSRGADQQGEGKTK